MSPEPKKYQLPCVSGDLRMHFGLVSDLPMSPHHSRLGEDIDDSDKAGVPTTAKNVMNKGFSQKCNEVNSYLLQYLQ